jgi:hypothetical protein
LGTRLLRASRSRPQSSAGHRQSFEEVVVSFHHNELLVIRVFIIKVFCDYYQFHRVAAATLFLSIGKPTTIFRAKGVWVDYQNILTAIEAGIRFTE